MILKKNIQNIKNNNQILEILTEFQTIIFYNLKT